jgi:hypothetical protein
MVPLPNKLGRYKIEHFSFLYLPGYAGEGDRAVLTAGWWGFWL